MKRLLVTSLLALTTSTVHAADGCLDQAVDAHAFTGGAGQIAIAALAPDGSRDMRVLGTPATGEGLQGSEGFRLASITKTYVAATALRLAEQGRLELQAPIDRYLPDNWMKLLASDGYQPHAMTVRQLLSHTSGMADAAQAPQFIATLKAHPHTQWTREGDLHDLVEWTDPVGRPGEKFAYSDTGYVLLGAIIEHITGQTLPQAARAQLHLDTLGVPGTYWERYEKPVGGPRAHQRYEGLDTYDWDPSMDLYGGGGLVAPPIDVAVFFDALLEGRVFSKPETLALMQSADGLPTDSQYRLGIFAYDLDGTAAAGHSGFWGTLVAREPVSGRTISGAVTDRADYPKLKQLVSDYVARAHAEATGRATCAATASAPATKP
ncbi:serine hydrolase domain-containing protein [Lysobacter yangpyeongensis]|uniref:Serine hydrolase domain-containing protein n=1 Tax=Lysobacter yangpyeongensis TaxID=346182 RepID=A0ABW0SPY4_9GAMM